MIANSSSSSEPAAQPRLAKSVRLQNSGGAIEIDRYSLPFETAVRHLGTGISLGRRRFAVIEPVRLRPHAPGLPANLMQNPILR